MFRTLNTAVRQTGRRVVHAPTSNQWVAADFADMPAASIVGVGVVSSVVSDWQQ